MKKTLGRVGASMSAVALLAGGLVSAAAPAQASHIFPDQTPDHANVKCYEGPQSDKVEGETAQVLCSQIDAKFMGATSDERHTTFTAWGQVTYPPEGKKLDKSEIVNLEKCDYFKVDSSPDKFQYCKNKEDLTYVGYVDEGNYGGTGYWTWSTYGERTDGSGGDGGGSGDGADYVCYLFEASASCYAESKIYDGDSCSSVLKAFAPGVANIEPVSAGDLLGCRGFFIDVDGNTSTEPVQKAPPPPPCWDASINNCPVGGALRFAAPKYAMVGVPVTMYAYASWRPDANSPSQPTNGTAVIRVDGEDYSGVEFKDGIAEWRFIPETEGMKEFTASGVLFSGLSGANAYIDTVPARTYVLEYDPAAYTAALKKKAVEVGETYVITDPNQARSYLKERYEWSVSEKSDDVCAVYETKKGAVKAKFTDSGKCTVIWLDKESGESGKYSFIAKK